MTNVLSLREALDPTIVRRAIDERRRMLEAPRVGQGAGVYNVTHANGNGNGARYVDERAICRTLSENERRLREACGSEDPLCAEYVGVISRTDVPPGEFALTATVQRPFILHQIIFPSSLAGSVLFRGISLGSIPQHVFSAVGPGVDVQVLSEASFRGRLNLAYIQGTNDIEVACTNITGAPLELVGVLLIGTSTSLPVNS